MKQIEDTKSACGGDLFQFDVKILLNSIFKKLTIYRGNVATIGSVGTVGGSYY